jgi:predicted DNA-binding helix-hairpin-helix protein
MRSEDSLVNSTPKRCLINIDVTPKIYYGDSSEIIPRQILVPCEQMAISNELSSDVAVALLANEKSPQELKKLKDIILEVHSTLQEMSEETRAYRFKNKDRQEGKKETSA